MFKQILKVVTILAILAFTLGYSQSIQPIKQTTYAVLSSNSSVAGVVQIGDYGLGNTIITVSLKGTSVGQHPAHFHSGDCNSNGDVVVPLENLDGNTGLSVTVTSVPFETIVSGNHYLNIHASPEDMATIVACGEVGSGALALDDASKTATGVKPEEFATSMRTAGYGIFPVASGSIKGQMQVAETAEGDTEIIVTLDGIERGRVYKLELRKGDCGPDRELLLDLNAVPSVLPEPNASATSSGLSFEEIAEGNNFVYVYAPDGSVAACGEVGLGALSQ